MALQMFQTTPIFPGSVNSQSYGQMGSASETQRHGLSPDARPTSGLVPYGGGNQPIPLGLQNPSSFGSQNSGYDPRFNKVNQMPMQGGYSPLQSVLPYPHGGSGSFLTGANLFGIPMYGGGFLGLGGVPPSSYIAGAPGQPPGGYQNGQYYDPSLTEPTHQPTSAPQMNTPLPPSMYGMNIHQMGPLENGAQINQAPAPGYPFSQGQTGGDYYGNTYSNPYGIRSSA